jgi:hypothetical protein
MAFDGTVESVPDSPANAAAFGYPDGGHRGRSRKTEFGKAMALSCTRASRNETRTATGSKCASFATG